MGIVSNAVVLYWCRCGAVVTLVWVLGDLLRNSVLSGESGDPLSPPAGEGNEGGGGSGNQKSVVGSGQKPSASARAQTSRRRLSISMQQSEFDSGVDALVAKYPSITVPDASRFMVAARGSLDQAAASFERYLSWRAKHFPMRRDRAAAALQTNCIFHHGTARDGTPVIYLKLSMYDKSKAPREQYMVALAYCIEMALQRTRSEAVTVLLAGPASTAVTVSLIGDLAEVALRCARLLTFCRLLLIF